MVSSHTHTSLIARNSLLNFAGQLVPLIIGVASIPFVIKGLGVDRFGILSLAWMLLGYFTLFDLGLGRATTKFFAEELRSGETKNLRTLFWSSCGGNLSLGVLGGLIIASLASFLAEEVFRIPAALVGEAKTAFLILALSVPIVLVSTALRGVLEASQRFDYVNAVNVISSSLTFLLPAVGVLIGFDVRGIILLLMILRLASASTYLLLCFKVYPILTTGLSFDLKRIRQLVTYGGWVSVSNVLNPILSYLDRFLIASLISIAAVSYYTAPYEMITRMWILPASLTMTLFPAFSAMGERSGEELTSLFARSVKYLLLAAGPLVMLLALFTAEILHLWLGGDFAEKSALVFQILALGVLFNSLAQIPYALIQGIGRPDITAKFHLLEVLLYIPLMWVLVKNVGIAGAAIAWTMRVVADSLLLFGAARAFTSVRVYLEKGLLRAIHVVLLMAGVVLVSSVVGVSLLPKAIIGVGLTVVFALASWRYVLDERERGLVTAAARQVAGPIGGAQ